MNHLNALRVFTRVVELGSFAAAARDLGLSPAMVGNHVRSLEKWFGASLILRTTRQQNLTVEGREVIEHAAAMIAGMTALDEVARRNSDPAGPLRISAPIGIGRHFVAPIMQRLLQKYPKLRIDLRLSDQPEDLVKSGLDLAVRNGPLTGGESLIARNVARQTLLLGAAPVYAKKAGLPANLDELRTHKTVCYSRDGRPRLWLFPTADGMVQIDPPTSFMATDIETLCDAAVSGFGIIWQPHWLLAPHFESGALLQVMADHPALTIDTYLVRPDAPPPKRVRVAADFLAAELSQKLGR
jgi:DNA-binding transcriptional LysR family regulator